MTLFGRDGCGVWADLARIRPHEESKEFSVQTRYCRNMCTAKLKQEARGVQGVWSLVGLMTGRKSDIRLRERRSKERGYLRRGSTCVVVMLAWVLLVCVRNQEREREREEQGLF